VLGKVSSGMTQENQPANFATRAATTRPRRTAFDRSLTTLIDSCGRARRADGATSFAAWPTQRLSAPPHTRLRAVHRQVACAANANAAWRGSSRGNPRHRATLTASPRRPLADVLARSARVGRSATDARGHAAEEAPARGIARRARARRESHRVVKGIVKRRRLGRVVAARVAIRG